MASGSVLGAPGAVAERSPVAESIANATALGVDVYGEIPADAVRVSDGSYTAEPGSQAWAWIRAQIDLPNTLETRNEIENRAALEKRQAANIGIGMFSQDWCKSFPLTDRPLLPVAFLTVYSIQVRERPLGSTTRATTSTTSATTTCSASASAIAGSAATSSLTSASLPTTTCAENTSSLLDKTHRVSCQQRSRLDSRG